MVCSKLTSCLSDSPPAPAARRRRPGGGPRSAPQLHRHRARLARAAQRARWAAARVLGPFGISLAGAREEVAARVGAGGTEPVRGHIPFTPRAKKVLELALREALQLHHNYIGTEHILLGLIREKEGAGPPDPSAHADLSRDPRGSARPAARGPPGHAGPPLAAPPGRYLLPGEPGPGRVVRTPPQPPRPAWTRPPGSPDPAPVGSHHLLLAALADSNTAAARALAGPRRRSGPGAGRRSAARTSPAPATSSPRKRGRRTC